MSNLSATNLGWLKLGYCRLPGHNTVALSCSWQFGSRDLLSSCFLVSYKTRNVSPMLDLHLLNTCMDLFQSNLYSRKSTGGTNNINDGSILFVCPTETAYDNQGLGCSTAKWITFLMLAVTPVLFLLWYVKVSAVKTAYCIKTAISSPH